MKLAEVLRFEFGCQARRVVPWVAMTALLGITYQIATQVYLAGARTGGFFFNAPFVIATMTVLGSAMGLAVTAIVASDAATRDVQSRMHPLLYAAPIGKAAWLGGRFLAAFILNAVILLAVPAGLLAAFLLAGADLGQLGPARPAVPLGAFVFLALPNAFVATALVYVTALLTRRALMGWLASALFFFASTLCWQLLAARLGHWEIATILDPLGLTAMSGFSRSWTAAEKNARLAWLEAPVIVNRVVWLAIALAVLALAWRRFRFAHHASGRGGRERTASRVEPTAALLHVPATTRRFGVGTRLRQMLAIAGDSFRTVVASRGAFLMAAFAALMVLLGPGAISHMGVPRLPTTGLIASFLAAPLLDPREILWLLGPLLIVLYAGELVWRERDAGLEEMADAAPVPGWALPGGKLLGLFFSVAALQTLMIVTGVLIQARLGWTHFQPGLYATIFFGFQLVDYFLFALMAFVTHVVVNQKHAGHLVALLAYGFMAFSPALGIEHNLLVYLRDPGWSHSDMRGFEPFAGPWITFKLYWAGWAMLLAVAARLLWVRGRQPGFHSRLRWARRRLTRPALGAAGSALVIVLAVGGLIFHQTNVLNAYTTTADRQARRAEYERRYGRYEALPQPRLTAVTLHAEIHPTRREASVRGTYRLVNESGTAIERIHLAADPELETSAIRFDRAAACELSDDRLGQQVHRLHEPLMPGDSLALDFEVRFRPHGFSNEGMDPSVASHGTFFTSGWLPSIGYRRSREIADAAERSALGLPSRPGIRPLDDVQARADLRGAERIAFEAVVGTEDGQTALAPGVLRRTWLEGGRRYFHYVTDAPIRNEYAIFSSDYAVHESRWRDVAIEIHHHPGHAWNLDRLARSIQTSLEVFTRRFGPYPHRVIRLVEHPGPGVSLHAYPVNIAYEEGFPLLNPQADERGIDLPFAVVAHEVAHQWWGNQLSPADVEGAPLLTETLAWFSAMAVVEETYGPEHLGRLLDMLREESIGPRPLADVPLLRADSWFLGYRKGPFAMYALREYIGDHQVSAALRRLLKSHGTGEPPLPTSRDLYAELRRETPDSLQPLLSDLFEANTWWELSAKQAASERNPAGMWQVTIDVQARKLVVDLSGASREVPMDDLVEVGVYGDEGADAAPLDLRTHRIHSGAQRLTVTVPRRPARAAIDPRHLLMDARSADNVADVSVR